MPTVSSDVDTFLGSADKAAMGTALGAVATSGATAFSNGLHVHKGNVQGVVIGQMALATGHLITNASDAVRIGFGANETGIAASGGSTSAVCIGRHALSNGFAPNSVHIGHAPGQYVTEGSGAVVIGYLAGRNTLNVSPFYTFGGVMIGASAGENARNGQNSVMLGGYAGASATNAVGAVLIGYNAGRTATNAGSSVIIGFNAGYAATNSVQSVLIGTRAGYSLSRNNSLVIEAHPAYSDAGNTGLIYGEFDTRLLRFNATSMGLYGAIPVTKQSITGSRGGNAALADLLTKLALVGLITDSTSA